MSEQLWTFEALDTWFFRESRPFNTIGGTQLASQFPPPPRTLAGAVRTAIGEANGVDWQQYQKGSKYQRLRDSMGDACGYGTLEFTGPLLLKGGKRLYPAPLLLLEKEADGKKEYIRLQPGQDAVNCDIGEVLLPELPTGERGAKLLEGCWLTEAGLRKVLSGGVPDAIVDNHKEREVQVLSQKVIFEEEERLGIGRNNETRSNIDKLLYQTRHIRPREDISVALGVSGLNDEFTLRTKDGINRLGGEGRMGAFSIETSEANKLEITPSFPSSTKVLLVLLTAGDFGSNWMFPSFSQQRNDDNDADEWHGVINGVELKIISAAIGKPVREGGWDVANRKSRDLRSMVPPGSCYFCEVIEGNAQGAVDQLQGFKVGDKQATTLGRGELAAGYW